MAASPESEDEEKELRRTVLETANIALQIRQRAEQKIRRANEVLEQRTRALVALESATIGPESARCDPIAKLRATNQ
jgi:hypothetical protein